MAPAARPDLQLEGQESQGGGLGEARAPGPPEGQWWVQGAPYKLTEHLELGPCK